MKDLKSFKNELQNIIHSNEFSGQKNLIKAAQAHLRNCSSAGENAESKQSERAEEERALADFADANLLWVQEESLGTYITEGAEQRVFFPEGKEYVIKTADSIFYSCWLDYFNNLLLHNHFFQNTEYELMGFIRKEGRFMSVLKQPFIAVTEATNLENVRLFLSANGFQHKKNNDYYHPYLGIILEDLHDENVLTNGGALFFVDTVFYITEQFYQQT